MLSSLTDVGIVTTEAGLLLEKVVDASGDRSEEVMEDTSDGVLRNAVRKKLLTRPATCVSLSPVVARSFVHAVSILVNADASVLTTQVPQSALQEVSRLLGERSDHQRKLRCQRQQRGRSS